MEYAFLVALLLLAYKKFFAKNGWSSPTKEDIDWANRNSDLIDRNS